MLRVNRDRFAQGSDGIITPADATQALREFMQKTRGIAVSGKQWRQYIQSLLRHFLQAISRCQYPLGFECIGVYLQNLMHLLFGQPWIVSEQISRILEGGLQVPVSVLLAH